MNWRVDLPCLWFNNLTDLHVSHCITTRQWGSLNPFVGYAGLERMARGLALDKGERLAACIVYAEQVHGASVHSCLSSDAGSIRLGVDGLLTREPSLVLAVYVADCTPIFLYDPVQNTVAVLHAGRRGLVGGIIETTIRLLQSRGSRAADLVVGIGPGLRPCCYEVQTDIFPELESATWMAFVEQRDGKFFLDTFSPCRRSLKACGIPDAHIEEMPLCTACHSDLLFSARRRTEADERGASCAAVISLPGPHHSNPHYSNPHLPDPHYPNPHHSNPHE